MLGKHPTAAFGLAAILAGCTTAPTHQASKSPWTDTPFRSYREAFKFIAQSEGLPTDSKTLLQLAADSKVVVHHFDGIPALYIVEANYYAGGIYNQIRGVQLNGRYYVLRSLARDFAGIGNLDRGFELIGVLQGNTYRWDNTDDRLRLITTWHVSAPDNKGSVYDWDGRVFRQATGE